MFDLLDTMVSYFIVASKAKENCAGRGRTRSDSHLYPKGCYAKVTVTFGLGKFASISIVNLNRNSLQGEDAQHRLSKLRLPDILTY